VIDDQALWATDSLLDALSLGELPVDDDRGLALLSALVVDVSADLPTASPLPDDLRARRSRLRRLAPRTGVALAAAVAVVSTGGVAAASVNAGPTSALFPLHQVLTGQPQLDGSQRQALEVRDKLQSATKALAAGKVDRAQKDVTAAGSRIPKVAEADGRRDLTAQWVMVNKQVKAHVAAPPLPVTPTETVLPTPAHSPSVTRKPSVSPRPVVSPTTSSAGAPVPLTPPPAAPTSAAPTTPSPTQVAPTSPQPSDTATVVPPPSDVAPSATVTPDPSASPGKGGHHGKGGKGSTPTPTAAQGSPVDPIVITPDPTVTLSAVPGNLTAPAPAPSASAAVPSGQAGSVPTSSDSPPASSTPSANPLA
jgi:hypothetical protein